MKRNKYLIFKGKKNEKEKQDVPLREFKFI